MTIENLGMMYQVVKILREELTMHPYYNNYFLKYGTYTFTVDKSSCEHLLIIFINGFSVGLKKHVNKT